MATREPAASDRPNDESARLRRDHEAIGRLADELLPLLVARLTASGLGEIEVRENGWKARLRKPAGHEAMHAVPVRATESHTAHGHAAIRPGAGQGRDDRVADSDAAAETPDHLAVTSSAVGIFHPRKDLATGMNVRAGDRVGYVDVLGVHEDLVSPVNGVIGSSLAEAGEAVEYGQELIRIEPPDRPSPAGARAGRQPAAAGKP